MKKYSWIIVVLVAALILSNGYWIYREQTRVTWQEETQKHMQAYIAAAVEHFGTVTVNGFDRDYYMAVCNVYAAWNEMEFLTGVNGNDASTEIGKLCVYLVNEPEACRANAYKIRELLKNWQKDPYGETLSEEAKTVVLTISEYKK